MSHFEVVPHREVTQPELLPAELSLPDAGYVTAEAAVVIPMLVLFTGMLLWGLMAASAQIRCVDAARAGARAAARSEPRAAALAAAESAAPQGASVVLRREGDLVRVHVTAQSLGPGRMAGLLSVTVGADAVALAEDTVQ
jgi:hypothetical protein